MTGGIISEGVYILPAGGQPWEHPIKRKREEFLKRLADIQMSGHERNIIELAFVEGAKAGIDWREGKLPL